MLTWVEGKTGTVGLLVTAPKLTYFLILVVGPPKRRSEKLRMEEGSAKSGWCDEGKGQPLIILDCVILDFDYTRLCYNGLDYTRLCYTGL